LKICAYCAKAVFLHRQTIVSLAMIYCITNNLLIQVSMKRTFIALVLGALLTIPCVLRAEEIEIQLTEVIQMTPLPGDDPLDDPGQIWPLRSLILQRNA